MDYDYKYDRLIEARSPRSSENVKKETTERTITLVTASTGVVLLFAAWFLTTAPFLPKTRPPVLALGGGRFKLRAHNFAS